MTRIEHANITVPDIDEAIRFIKIIAPDFVVRKDCSPEESYRWAGIQIISATLMVEGREVANC